MATPSKKPTKPPIVAAPTISPAEVTFSNVTGTVNIPKKSEALHYGVIDELYALY